MMFSIEPDDVVAEAPEASQEKTTTRTVVSVAMPPLATEARFADRLAKPNKPLWIDADGLQPKKVVHGFVTSD